MAETNKASRGRPKGAKKNNNIIEINNIKLEFIITKTYENNNEVSYLKVTDKAFKNKLQPIVSQICDEIVLPIWKADDGFYMVKVKKRWMPEGRVFEKNEFLTADLNFHYYSMARDEELIQGYYVRLSTNDAVLDTP